MKILTPQANSAGLVVLALFWLTDLITIPFLSGLVFAMDNLEPLNVTTATQEQLKALPGMDETYAKKIISRRTNEQFTRRDELQEVLPPAIYGGIKHLVIVGQQRADVLKPELVRTTHTSDATPSWTSLILAGCIILSMIGGWVLTLCGKVHRGFRTDEGISKYCRLLIWTGIGILSLGWACTAEIVAQCDEKDKLSVVKKFFETNQATLLTLVVALGAYTSTVEQLLRQKLKDKKGSASAKFRHMINLKYMYRTDIVLVLSGAALIWRIALAAFGQYDVYLDRLNIGLLAWIILYFCWNHIRVLVRVVAKN
jgi:Helix-hairpin-helix motif